MNTNKEKIYHIPLKDRKSENWYPIMDKLMGQEVGFTYFIRSKYIVIDFGFDEEG